MAATESEPNRSQGDNTRDATVAAHRATPIPLRVGARLMNPIMRQLAGKRYVRSFAVIEHRGRRSGRTYATPVAARRTTDGFVIPLVFGEQADWFRNVRAAGSCMIRWNGVAYHAVEPESVDWATARPAFGRVERMLAPLFARRFVRLRLARSGVSGVA